MALDTDVLDLGSLDADWDGAEWAYWTQTGLALALRRRRH